MISWHNAVLSHLSALVKALEKSTQGAPTLLFLENTNIIKENKKVTL